MAIIDDYKSTKNKDLLINASSRMIKDKFNVSVNDSNVAKVVLNIISVISNDVILINTNIKLNELNNLTLIKVKEYVEKQLTESSKTNSTEDNVTKIPVQVNQNTTVKPNDEADTLMDKVQELEEKRRISNTLLSEYLNLNEKVEVNDATTTQSSGNQQNVPAQIPIIIDNVYKSIEKKNKKYFIINSYSRDWIKNPTRNSLHFKINIDMSQNTIEPSKILFPSYVKFITPYIVMILTDSTKTQKYHFTLNRENGNWDEWILLNNESIIIQHQNWNITFYDHLNKELDLGNDDISVTEVMFEGDDYFKLKISNSDEHNMNMLEENKDYVMLKTFDNNIHNIKIIKNNNGGFIIKKNDFKQEDFINSKILNTRAQYCIFFQYSAKD